MEQEVYDAAIALCKEYEATKVFYSDLLDSLEQRLSHVMPSDNRFGPELTLKEAMGFIEAKRNRLPTELAIIRENL